MKTKNNSPINNYELVQYKLDAYFDNLPENGSRKEYIEDKIGKLDDNLTVWKREDTYRIKQKRVYCPHCYSKYVVEKGYYPRSLELLDYGLVHCEIKRYHCKHCNSDFSADISCMVKPHFTVANEVMNVVNTYYSIDFTSVRKIKDFLEKFHGVNISSQEIQDILVDYTTHYNINLKEYSGYYAFDALWIKIREISDKYVFLLTLVDVLHNTVIAYKVVEHETEEEVYKFLSEVLANQERKGITTDLKEEYRRPLYKLGFNHQFCEFHFKQNINTTLREYVKENNLPDEKIEEYKQYLPEIYQIFEVENQEEVEEIIDGLKNRLNKFPELIQNILNKKVFPYYKNLTYFIQDPKITNTSNVIERMFKELAPKHIKKYYVTLRGFLSRFSLKLRRWDEKNAVF